VLDTGSEEVVVTDYPENPGVIVVPAKETVTQLASTNMVTIRLLPFLAIPAQAGTHASTST
jgi:hypothetical protein